MSAFTYTETSPESRGRENAPILGDPHPTVSTSPPPPSLLQLLDKFVDVTKRAPAKLFGRSMNNRKRRGKTGPERFGNAKAWPISDWPFHVSEKRKSSEGRRL